MSRPRPEPTRPGEESVWDYPRPPRLERVHKRITLTLGGVRIVDTTGAWRVLETSHPPVYYVPPGDVLDGAVVSRGPGSTCEWKGTAHYFDVVGGDVRADKAAWSYPQPTPRFAPIADHLAFYAAPMDAVTVDGVVVTPQPGGFYGGWITPEIKGPFKGGPGSWGW
jgi:uncharacterized protein (DUF427 family)